MTPDLDPSLTKDYQPTQICAVTSVIKWFVNNHALQTDFKRAQCCPIQKEKQNKNVLT